METSRGGIHRHKMNLRYQTLCTRLKQYRQEYCKLKDKYDEDNVLAKQRLKQLALLTSSIRREIDELYINLNKGEKEVTNKVKQSKVLNFK